MTFCIVWALSTLFCYWRVIVILSIEGRVKGDDRFMLFLLLTPMSILAAVVLALIELSMLIDRVFHKWWDSPKVMTWRIERKIKKRWRGPLVRIVEHLHNKRQEKQIEKEISES